MLLWKNRASDCVRHCVLLECGFIVALLVQHIANPVMRLRRFWGFFAKNCIANSQSLPVASLCFVVVLNVSKKLTDLCMRFGGADMTLAMNFFANGQRKGIFFH